MKLGLQVPNFTWPASPVPFAQRLGDIARHAEDAGCSSFWVMDHFFQIQMVGPAENEMLEGYSALAYVAGITSKINLGTMVTGVTYRHPGLLIKTVTTLDVLSQGRAYLGIGAAWNEQEHLGLGVPFPPLKERFERLEETLRLAQQMFAGDEEPFQGKHYQLQRPLNSPLPVRRPHPPILIGGGGEKKTLRLVAQYGDACNLFEFQLAEIARKLDVLQEHCASVGRDYAEIEKTTLGVLALSKTGSDGTRSVAEAIDHYARLSDLGITQAIVSLPDVAGEQVWDLIPELVEGLAAVGN
ncbi:MAG: LLM class F420-dependent oxidoreductase [Nakamurella sp.]